jgi:hypothetical protein
VGCEKNENVQSVFDKYPTVFQELLDAARENSACTKGVKAARKNSACTKGVKNPGRHAIDDEGARLEIMKLVEDCKGCLVQMMDGRTSAFKDVLGSVVRLLLGEIFSESMGQLTDVVIGCTPEMFQGGHPGQVEAGQAYRE